MRLSPIAPTVHARGTSRWCPILRSADRSLNPHFTLCHLGGRMETILEEFLIEPFKKRLSNANDNAPWRKQVLKSAIWNVESFVDSSVHLERQNLDKVSKGTSTDDIQTDADQSETISLESYADLVQQLEEIRAEYLRNERPNEEVEELKRSIDELAEKYDFIAKKNDDITKELYKESYLRQEIETSYDMLKVEFVRITSALKEIHTKEITNMYKVHKEDANHIENKLWEEFESFMDKTKVEHQTEVETLNRKHVSEIENMENKRHQELKDMETKLKAEFETSFDNMKLQFEINDATMKEKYLNELEHLKIRNLKDMNELEHLKIRNLKDTLEKSNSLSCSQKHMMDYKSEIENLTGELNQVKTEIKNETEKTNLISSEMLDDFIGMCCKQLRLTDDLKKQRIIQKNEHQVLSMTFGQEKSELQKEIKQLQETTQVLTNDIHIMEAKMIEKEESFTQEIIDRNAKEHELNDMIKIKNVIIKNCLDEKQEDFSKFNAKLEEYKDKISTLQDENIKLKVDVMASDKILNDTMTDFMLEIRTNKITRAKLGDNMKKLNDFSNQQIQYDKEISDLRNRLISMEVQNESLTETNLVLKKELHEMKQTLNNVKSEKLQNENRFMEEQKIVRDELENERENSLHLQLAFDELKKEYSLKKYVKQRENGNLIAALQEKYDSYKFKEDKVLENLRLKLDTLKCELERYQNKSDELQSQLKITNKELKRECGESANLKTYLESSINELKSEKSKVANLKSQLDSITNELNKECGISVNLKSQVEKFNNKVNIERRKVAKLKLQIESLNNELTKERSNSEDLKMQMERLKNELEIGGTQSVELQSLLKSSKTYLKNERRNRAEVELRLEDLQAELEKEQSEYKNLQTQLKAMEKRLLENENINKDLKSVHEEFSKLKQDFLEEKLQLTANIKHHEDRIELRDTEIAKLKIENSSLILQYQNLKQELELIVNEKKDEEGQCEDLIVQVRNLKSDLELVLTIASHFGAGDGFSLNNTLNKKNGKAIRAKSLEVEESKQKPKNNEIGQSFEQFLQKSKTIELLQVNADSKPDLKLSLSNETNSRRTSYKSLLSPIRELSESGSSPDRRRHHRARKSQSSQSGKS
ncbi:hypothetical protein WDU94_003290 [Cyamophila willieti]